MTVSPQAWLSMNKKDADEFVANVAPSIRDELASGHKQRCRMCGTVGCETTAGETTLKGEYHESNCPNCSGVFRILRFIISVHQDREVRRTKTYVLNHSRDGCETITPGTPTAETLVKSVEYPPTCASEIRERIHGHHIRYEPEITIPVCASCHMTIHNEEEYDELQPLMKRNDWSG